MSYRIPQNVIQTGFLAASLFMPLLVQGQQAQPKAPIKGPVSMAAPNDLVKWADPALTASPSQPVTFKKTVRFAYKEQAFDPPYRIAAPIPKASASYATPEDAAIARISALMEANVDWWLSIWDAKTRKEQDEILKKAGEGERLAANWKDIFTLNRAELKHKITYGNYVIITYDLVNSRTNERANQEFPSIFHLEGGVWKATNDLRSVAMIPLSPWASGKSSYEETFK
jgi:hypothetical protein